MPRGYILTWVFCLFIIPTNSQSKYASKVDSIFVGLKKGQTTYTLERNIYKDSLNYKQSLWILRDYLNNDNDQIKAKASKIVFYIGKYTTDSVIKEHVVSLLVERLEDKNSGFVKVILDYLKSFDKQCFNLVSKSKIIQLVRDGTSHYPDLIRLSGQLEIVQLSEFYRNNLVSNNIKSESVKWAMHLALAKMGDEWEVEYCIDLVKKLGLNDDVVLDFFPDLIYIDARDGYRYMLSIILSDAKNCRSPQPDIQEEIICAFKVIELIAPHVTNFPVKLNKYGEIETDDYYFLLSTVRKWIQKEWIVNQH